MIVLSLIVGTLLSEDLTCVAAGLLIQQGKLGAPTAVLACAIGIFVGDVGLWAVGRLCGRAALEWPWVARRLREDRVRQLRGWLTRHAASAIVGSRFMPGTRLPLYVIAGLVRLPAPVFVLWALIGTALWTPPVVLFSAGLDGALRSSVPVPPGVVWLFPAISAGAVLLILHLARRLTRTRVAAAASVVDLAGGA